MKKTTLFLVLITITSYGYSQESKVYFGRSIGVFFPEGKLGEKLNTGPTLGINFGYRFSEQWGATLNTNASIHPFDIDEDHFFLATYDSSIGPMYTIPFNNIIYWDIKPQLALLTGVMGTHLELKGSAFVLGNSFVFGNSKGWKFFINIDYLTGRFTQVKFADLSSTSYFEVWKILPHLRKVNSIRGYVRNVDEDNGFSKFSLGCGVRYNF